MARNSVGAGMRVAEVTFEGIGGGVALAVALRPRDMGALRDVARLPEGLSFLLVDRMGNPLGRVQLDYCGVNGGRAIFQAAALHPAVGGDRPQGPEVLLLSARRQEAAAMPD